MTGVRNGVVDFVRHYSFPSADLVSTGRLRFRTESELRTSLTTAGFNVDWVYGGWSRQPVGSGDGELIFGGTRQHLRPGDTNAR